ncbi:FIVAR domain-containing protein, partial [Lactobacillus paragasseri]
ADEPYTVETGTDGKFSVNLGKLNDSDQVSIYAAKDFVSSDTDTKTVSEWMTDSYRDQLQKLVNEAPTIEAGTNYTDADANLKTDYTNAISDGNTLLQNTSATSPQLEAAIKQITDAKTALNGDSNIAVAKEALQKAVDKATNIENSYQYYNAPENLQNAYKAAVAAGNNALKETNPTLADLQKALTDITTAEGNLNGKETNKNALQAAVDNSTTVKSSNNYTNADESKKAAYDNAVTAAQAILDKTNATQTEVDQALQNLETANNNLNGDAKTEAANRAALEAAVKEAPTVRETPAFYNGTDESQKAYNDAITAGQNVLNNTNATADQVKDALDAINTAKGNLKGEATNTDALQTALTKANDAKQTGNYTNADQANQEALTNAITAGQNVLTKNNATQAEVDNAVKTINDAISG